MVCAMPDSDRTQYAAATRRALEIAGGMFPATFRPDMADVWRISVGLLARCVTTTEACLHLAALGRRSDLMVCVRTLFEHTVMFAWLMGDLRDAEHRMLLWQRYSDAQSLLVDDEMARFGGQRRISEKTRDAIADANASLGTSRMPGLADRAAKADVEWAERLGFDARHREVWSLRRTYSVIFRVGSAVAHPTLAGLAFVTDRNADRIVIEVEPAGKASEALQPVPLLLGTALAVSAHALGRPGMSKINAYIDWLSGSIVDD